MNKDSAFVCVMVVTHLLIALLVVTRKLLKSTPTRAIFRIAFNLKKIQNMAENEQRFYSKQHFSN